ncbi:aldo/keto reductase [Cellulomonas marina]|uniref:Predicted oxidoreductase n=1 Tax=Cellulomonas marina TaxID=988821 RepID=A0A1I1AB31_9CELL|nr:aldo/keto reductase [Cellulomonas marina]GIG30368.1 NADP-dependent aryl-alcohol dehydrogenase [Cellulomonas marina]SFB35164.1 Predicted oxidoreductase [Cellulomonas marina]
MTSDPGLTPVPLVPVGSSDLRVAPLALGGNVFGWTADEEASVAVLDAFRAAGGSLVDTADSYSAWVDGHTGGESERVIGRWLADRGCRDEVVVATKVSQHPDFRGLAPDTVRRAAHASLERLGVERIDLYYAHFDDESTPIEDTATAFSALVDEGVVRHVALSNYAPERIDAWMAAVQERGLHVPVALQPHYNLVERDFEGALRERAERYGLGVLPYFGLAKGFLAGKYREGGPAVDSPRAGQAAGYLDDRGRRVLAVLDEVAEAHGVAVASVSLAWLRRQPTVVGPIASARSTDQLADLVASMTLELTPAELEALDAASRPTP